MWGYNGGMKWRVLRKKGYVRYDNGRGMAFDNCSPSKSLEQVKANVYAYDPAAFFVANQTNTPTDFNDANYEKV